MATPAPASPSAGVPSGIATSTGNRAGAFLIDFLPAVLVGLVGWIPIVGPMIAAVILTPYWLLRDINGASLGKLALKLRVAGRDGGAVAIHRRILRNVPLAVGPACLIVPFIGPILAMIFGGIAMLTEMVLVGTPEGRLGDRWAKTVVVSR